MLSISILSLQSTKHALLKSFYLLLDFLYSQWSSPSLYLGTQRCLLCILLAHVYLNCGRICGSLDLSNAEAVTEDKFYSIQYLGTNKKFKFIPTCILWKWGAPFLYQVENNMLFPFSTFDVTMFLCRSQLTQVICIEEYGILNL